MGNRCNGIDCIVGHDDKCINCGTVWSPTYHDLVPWFLWDNFDDTLPIWFRQIPNGAIYTQQSAAALDESLAA